MSTKPTTAEEGAKAIAALVEQAYAAINAAEAIANEFKLGFSFDVARGMGGWYNGGEPDEDAEDEYGEDGTGWNPSSQSC